MWDGEVYIVEIGKEHAFMYSAKFLQKFVGTLHVYGWLKGLIVSEILL